MSLFLYRLGGAIAARRGWVIGGWALVLALVVGSSGVLGDQYDDAFSVPGTQSQEGQDLLADRFDQTGTTGELLFIVDSGAITYPAPSQEVADLVKAVGDVPGVSVSNPLTADDPVVSSDKRAALTTVRFDAQVPSESTLDAVQRAAGPSASSTVTTSVGGDAYKPSSEPSRVPELIGLGISFVILALTFGSLLAAGMPIVTALIGVAVTLSAVVLASWVGTVSSTAPTLAEMLGLAVGIDYSLFILSRHRRHLAEGLAPVEAMRRAMATAGSAVVFAGATVVIALTGLAVARIPVLTVMGLAAAVAVVVAVLLALTLLPAVALLLGEQLRPRARSRRSRPEEARPARKGVARRWVAVTTRFPVVTILVVLVLLVLAARPASDLKLALPDNSTAPTGTAARETYDAITASFGEGYNAPLSVTADVITSSDPKSTVQDLAAAIAKVPDVVDITQATPNEGGDTALIQVIPKEGQTAPSTKALVQELRDRSAGWEKTYGVHDMLVTGQTAVNIDVSARLAGALLPFAIIVIGLSLILLMVVFRSIAVPLKATLGYLLSVGVALGAVVAVFEWGWLDALGEPSTGPVVSFMPIFVMGVLFGLAMDYEMFLVSAMREEYVRSGDARAAVVGGFASSARVVTAAALIMGTVFIAFIPGGSSTIKPIAFGLAVGVFVDAFVVRMTFVPAVLALLGRSAWWLPRWLDRRVPDVDVEGAVLHRKIAFEEWERDNGEVSVLARDVVVGDGDTPVEITARPGEVHRLDLPDGARARALGQVLTGRARPRGGSVVVDGLLLPEQREAVSRRTTLVEVRRPRQPDLSVEEQVRVRAKVASAAPRRRRAFVARSLAVVERLAAVDGIAARDPAALAEVATAVAAGAEVIVLYGAADGSGGRTAEALAAAVASEGVTVIVAVATGGTDVGEVR